MRARDGYAALAVFGLVLLRIAASDRLLLYVRPATRPYVLATGVAVALAGAAAWLTATEPRLRSPRVAVLLVAPVLAVVLVPPPSDGALVGTPRAGPPTRPDAALAPLRGPDPVAMDVAVLVQRAVWAPHSLVGHRLRVLGFVTAQRTGGLTIARLSITCCAADAQQDDVEVRVPAGAGTSPVPSDRWISVIGRFVGMSARNRFLPLLIASKLDAVAAPADPYD